MKFINITVAALLPFVAISSPVPEENGLIFDQKEHTSIVKRDVTGTVDADALKYRRCPRTGCDAVGQYSRGTRITIKCYTDQNTTPVNNYKPWGKLSNNYWVSLYYVNWSGSIQPC
ncbi:hypothetical protein B0J11DRAFT_602164 [Dendryphion nanum]|uniref:Uncharacterized protein n=1 Tax=Dendryphion nanum TaxID=256645 RepID=A0A9P9I6B9_9PLEO|nr:hypothetical protein B0J11DRAFT_602164 [Dendryphion nanum]